MKYILLMCCLIHSLHLTSSQEDNQPRIADYGPSWNVIEKGSTLTLRCRSVQTVIKWFKDGRQVFPVDDQRFDLNDFNDLVIINAQPGASNSEGKYTCTATNSVNTTSPGYNLEVIVQFIHVNFVHTPRDTFFYNIDGKRLAWANCQPPNAAPGIVPVWLNGSSLLPVSATTDPRIEIRTFSRKGTFSQLLIHNATQYDVGRWMCKASHRLGTKYAHFHISLYGPPKAAENMRVAEHRLNGFIMKWDYLRNDLLFYDIIITKILTSEVQRFKLMENPSYTQQTLKFQFSNLERGTKYEVQMRATDKQGQVGRWSTKLSVTTVSTTPPIMVEHPATVSVGEGNTYNMSCVVDASPAATFRWFRNGVVIPITDNRYTLAGHILVIKDALHGRENSEAKYKCEAGNYLGKATSNEGELKVEWIGESFLHAPGHKIFYRNQKFLRISVRPPVGSASTIHWFKSGKIIRKSTNPQFSKTYYVDPTGRFYNALDIRNLGATIDDVYTVTASNLGGTRKMDFRLVLATAPLAINTLRMKSQNHGQIVLQWDPPMARRNIQQLGNRFRFRTDITRFELAYVDTSTGTEYSVSTVGEYTDNMYFSKMHVISRLKTGVVYRYKIRSIDRGNQISTWSSWFEHSIPSTLPPYIMEGPKPTYNVIANQNISIPCEVSATPTAIVTWYKDSLLLSNADQRFQMAEHNLIITFIQANYSGVFYCKAENKYGEVRSEKATVVVYYFNNNFQYFKNNSVVYDVDGYRDARILCRPPLSNPPAKVHWTNDTMALLKYNERIVRDDNYIINGINYYSLKILRATDFIGNRIGCAAYNPVFGFGGNRYKLVFSTIILLGKPSWKKKITVFWKIDGTLSVFWHRERDDIASYSILVKKNFSSFKVVNVLSSNDTSIDIRNLSYSIPYRIEIIAIDIAGQRSEPAVANVKEFNSIIVNISKDLKLNGSLHREGTNKTLTCDFIGDPKPYITWLKDGINITIINGSYEVSNDNRQMKLINIQRSIHAGNYQCLGSNKYNNIATSISKLEVSWIDHTFNFIGTNQTFYNKDGYRQVQFKCSPPDSYPPFIRSRSGYVKWMKERNMSNVTGIQSVERKNNLLVDIITFNATMDDVSEISCVYFHEAGLRQQTMMLTVIGKPSWSKEATFYWTLGAKLAGNWTKEREDIISYIISVKISKSPFTIQKVVATADTKIEIVGLQRDTSYRIEVIAIDVSQQKSLPSVTTIQAWNNIAVKVTKDLKRNPKTLKEGTSKILTCDFSGSPRPVITWLKDGINITIRNGSYEVSQDNRRMKLININRNVHAGKYQCVASNKNFQNVGSTISSMEVAWFNHNFKYNDSDKTFYDKDGFRRVKFACSPPDAYPPINRTSKQYLIWESMERVLNGVTGTTQKGSVILDFIEFDATVKDIGPISCIYVHEAGVRRYGKMLKQIEKPEWKNGVNFYWKDGPKIYGTWKKERSDIVSYIVTFKENVSPHNIIKVVAVTSSTVEIFELPMNQSYRVEVVAIDVALQSSTPAVTVIKAASEVKVAIDLPLNSGSRFKEGKNATLMCDFSGNPKPSITWLKDGINISMNNGSYEVSNDNRQMNLINIDRNIHAGKYQCVASNVLSRNISTKILNVEVAWIDYKFKFATTDQVFENHDCCRKVRFFCSPPNAYPDFNNVGRILWLKGRNDELVHGRQTVQYHNSLRRDVIEFNATETDAGQISCVYIHEAGSRRHNMYLKIHDGPLPPYPLKITLDSYNFATLIWTASNERIENYHLVYGPDPTNITIVNIPADKTKYVIEDLKDEQAYKLSLFSVKQGKLSMPLSEEFTTVKSPDIPSVVNFKASSIQWNSISFTWDISADVYQLRKYQLVVKSQFATKYYDLTGAATSYTVKDLKEKELYTVSIYVVDRHGGKGKTSQLTLTTADFVPSTVPNFIHTAITWNSVLFSWDTPPDNTKVSMYKLKVKSSTATLMYDINRTSNTYSVRNLHEGEKYTFGIYGVDEKGRQGKPSEISLRTVDLGIPSAPRNITTSNVIGYENTQISITWLTPANKNLANNPPNEISYHLRLCDETACKDMGNITEKEIRLRGLTPKTNYNFTLTTMRADFRPGKGYAGVFETKLTIPRIKGFRMSIQKWDSISLIWDKPSSSQLRNVSNYVLVVNRTQVYEVQHSANQYTVGNLREGTIYVFSTYPVSGNGEKGLPTTVSVQTLNLGIPGVPQHVRSRQVGRFENTQVDITWVVPRDEELANNLPNELSYHMRYCNQIRCYNISSIKALSVRLFDLSPGTNYTFNLTTIRADMLPGESITGSFQTHPDVPSVPKSLKWEKSFSDPSTALTLRWVHPKIMAGTAQADMTFLVLYCKRTERKSPINCKRKRITGTSIGLTDLEQKTSYDISVSAIHYTGAIGEAFTITVTTEEKATTLSTAVISGIVVGIVVLILLATLSYYYYYRGPRKERKKIKLQERIEKEQREQEEQQKQIKIQERKHYQHQKEICKQKERNLQKQRYQQNRNIRRYEVSHEMQGRGYDFY